MAAKAKTPSSDRLKALKKKWAEWKENHREMVKSNAFAHFACGEVLRDINFLVGLIEGEGKPEPEAAEEAELEEAAA